MPAIVADETRSLADVIQDRIDSAVAAGDQKALDDLLNELYEPSETADRPYDAAIRLRPDIRLELAEVALESNAALNWANKIARASRWVGYKTKTALGFDGLRIVEEGDSWTQYPLLLEDIVDQLGSDPDKAIFSLGAAGDLVEDMAARKEYFPALQQSGASILLLSGGGNDILGDGRFAHLLLPFEEGKAAEDLLDLPRLNAELEKVLAAYRIILSDVRRRFPKVRVLGHGYDVPYPQNGARWIGKPLAERGISLVIGRKIVELILDRFADSLRALSAEFGNFQFVDLRGKVDKGRASWFDELHPQNAGFGRAAEEFRKAIKAISVNIATEVAVQVESTIGDSAAGSASSAMREGTVGGNLPGFEAASGAVIVLDPGHGGAPPPVKLDGSSWNNAIGPSGTLEKTLTLDVAKKTRALLEDRGFEVLLTREGDNNLSLENRAAVSKRRDAPVFVSIHFNASTGHNAQGTETFVHTNHSDASGRLCKLVQRAMVEELGLADRNASHPGGIKKGAFGVIDRDSHSPRTAAVLHEVSFLDRIDEEGKLKTEAYRARIAKALARGIESYMGTALESVMLETVDADEIGDSIELAAAAAGHSAWVAMGFAEAGDGSAAYGSDPNAWIGGHGLDTEARTAGTDFARQIAETLVRDRVSFADNSTQDLHEFAAVDVGAGFNVSDMGYDMRADMRRLEVAFANVESATFDMARYEAFIRGLGLSHFSPVEFLFLGNSNAPGGRCAGHNGLPPEDLWPNIAKTARMLDAIRQRLGAPIRILSCYRNASYNACVGGEDNSLHMRFNAVDWHCDRGTVDSWHRAALDVRSSSPEFAGGIGRYSRQGFIHVDTRGTNRDWNG
ncbi:DUF882 domain-containing protein [Rhizobium leguminosarum]|uniref:N-acetylmuramoyl-L-alanine amidase n=1 Tax=Rhizobium leguminosarum TaxID=384 RepID=UPI001C96CC1A|nr:N-acetylmuramoyl-L-alanine amidase [Rhizobium leguminosarum]MBY5706970.1 DUF882 domain-containing protein [Rhizobium leguminosarum]